jgi:hypothetical protein
MAFHHVCSGDPTVHAVESIYILPLPLPLPLHTATATDTATDTDTDTATDYLPDYYGHPF